MARRSYRQHCGLAAALDVVSQRWALLIVRDLAPGPRRFSDLFGGLPGIATDMLTDRLRSLESVGAVERIEVTDPAPATLYQLTPRGHELARINGELAKWGSELLPPLEETPLLLNPRWALQSFASRYSGGAADETYHFRVDGNDDLTLRMADGRAVVRYGKPQERPTAALECTTGEFFDLLRGAVTCSDGSETPVRGDVVGLQQVFDTMRSVLGTSERAPELE